MKYLPRSGLIEYLGAFALGAASLLGCEKKMAESVIPSPLETVAATAPSQEKKPDLTTIRSSYSTLVRAVLERNQKLFDKLPFSGNKEVVDVNNIRDGSSLFYTFKNSTEGGFEVIEEEVEGDYVTAHIVPNRGELGVIIKFKKEGSEFRLYDIVKGIKLKNPNKAAQTSARQNP